MQTTGYLPFREAWSRPPYLYPLELPEECDVVGPLCIKVPALWKAVEISEAKATQIASRGMDLAGYEPSVRTKFCWVIKCLLVLHKTNVSEASQEQTSLKDGDGHIVGS